MTMRMIGDDKGFLDGENDRFNVQVEKQNDENSQFNLLLDKLATTAYALGANNVRSSHQHNSRRILATINQAIN